MKIKINKEKCIGCGSCVSIAPETFDFNDDGKAEIINNEGENALIKEAIEYCPTAAIEIDKK